MHGEENQAKMEMNQFGLSQEEARDLQASLNAEEWSALLDVQHALANAPLLSPSAAFGGRVLSSLAVREQRRARRRTLLGLVSLAFGTILFAGMFIWLSPFGVLTEVNGWVEILYTFTSFVGVMAVVFEVARTFTGVVYAPVGEWVVLSFSLFALMLTILWTRIVVGWTPLNRPEPV